MNSESQLNYPVTTSIGVFFALSPLPIQLAIAILVISLVSGLLFFYRPTTSQTIDQNKKG
ncbi:hypothetical protein Q4Q40_23260 [Flavivirga jejuensis]|uniref:Uncharacterized protein n=1 Tax=Flavivirga jejuensis TaxID=870487 RepID=A0ABT8WW56_9FLAO|nr:hypothetical protein [Flavivirga jejuensis]